MSTKLPQVDKLVIPGQKQADLADVVTAITVDYGVDQVAELTVTMIDPGEKLTRAAANSTGGVLTFDGERWQIGSVEAQLAEYGALLTIRARDPLAKALRATYKTSGEKKVSPGDWVKRRVTAAGGTATVQQSSKRGAIAQSKNESVLDIIGNLAADLEWSWVSHSGRLWFGSRYYAWQGKLPALPMWLVSWKADPASDAYAASWTVSDDDVENSGDLELEVPYEHGKRLRPWHRISSTIPGATGTWLVEEVGITHDGFTPVTIRASRPKKPSPKAGSSNKES